MARLRVLNQQTVRDAVFGILKTNSGRQFFVFVFVVGIVAESVGANDDVSLFCNQQVAMVSVFIVDCVLDGFCVVRDTVSEGSRIPNITHIVAP